MNNESPASAPRKSWVRRIARFLLLLGVVVIALAVIASLIWKFSGSGQWELIGDHNGVKVYSLKAPGLDIAQVKGVVRVRSTLAGLVAFMQDPTVCSKIGCRESYVIERVDDQLMYTTFRYNFPFRFRPREFVLRAHFSQNPRTRAVLLEYAAVPEKPPPSDCCVRITDMNNTWQFTPVGNGQVEIEYLMNMDDGGFMPDPLINYVRPKVMFRALPVLQKLVSNEKYQKAKFDFVTEQ